MTSAEPSVATALGAEVFLNQPAIDLLVPVATDDSFAQTMARVSAESTATVGQPAAQREPAALNSTASRSSASAAVPGEVAGINLESGVNQPPRNPKEKSEDSALQALISGAFLSVFPPLLPPVSVSLEDQTPNALVAAANLETRPAQEIGEATVVLPSAFLASDVADGTVSQRVEHDTPDVKTKGKMLTPLGAEGGGGEKLEVGAKTNQTETVTANGEGGGQLAPVAHPDRVSLQARSVPSFETRNPTVRRIEIPVANGAIPARPNAASPQGETEQPVPAWAVTVPETADDTAAVSTTTPKSLVAGRGALPSASAIIGSPPSPELTARDSGQPPARSSSSDGTDVAQQENRVKSAAQANKVAAPAEQKLPSGEALVLATATDATDPRMSKARGTAVLANAKLDLSDASLPQLLSSVPPAVEPMDAIMSAWPLDAGAASSSCSGKLHSQIVQQVVELKHVGADSMAVVVKPDARTEIILHLQLHDGMVNVRAQFERGDFVGLNADWGQIQQALSQQGIQLGPLREPSAVPLVSNPAMAERSPQTGSGHDDRHHRPQIPDSLGDLPLVGSMTEPLHRRGGRRAVVSGSRWESWA